jgi:hypothetical protein
MLGRAAKIAHYHNRAEQMRQLAWGIYDREDRRLLLEKANEYEKMTGTPINHTNETTLTNLRRLASATGFLRAPAACASLQS